MFRSERLLFAQLTAEETRQLAAITSKILDGNAREELRWAAS